MHPAGEGADSCDTLGAVVVGGLPDVLQAEVPDEGDRAALAAAAPALPQTLGDVDIPASSGWEPASRSCLRLSTGYRAEAEDPAARGWHVEHLEGQHGKLGLGSQ